MKEYFYTNCMYMNMNTYIHMIVMFVSSYQYVYVAGDMRGILSKLLSLVTNWWRRCQEGDEWPQSTDHCACELPVCVVLCEPY